MEVARLITRPRSDPGLSLGPEPTKYRLDAKTRGRAQSTQSGRESPVWKLLQVSRRCDNSRRGLATLDPGRKPPVPYDMVRLQTEAENSEVAMRNEPAPDGKHEHRSTDDGTKWWRWESHVGRWMPSEPPAVNTGATQWRVSTAPPSEPPTASQPSEHQLRRVLNPYAG